MARRNESTCTPDYKLVIDLHTTMQGILSSLSAISSEIESHNQSITEMRISVSKCQMEARASRENNMYALLKDLIKGLLIIIMVLAGGAKVSGIW